LLLYVAGDVCKGGLGIGKQGVGEWGVGDEEGGDAMTFGLSSGLKEGQKVVVQCVHV